jgi:hypothetical protein
VQPKNAAYFFHCMRIALRGMVGLHDQLGLNRFDVGARVLHDAVVALLDRAIPRDRDDGVDRDGRGDGDLENPGSSLAALARSLTRLLALRTANGRDRAGAIQPSRPQLYPPMGNSAATDHRGRAMTAWRRSERVRAGVFQIAKSPSRRIARPLGEQRVDEWPGVGYYEFTRQTEARYDP